MKNSLPESEAGKTLALFTTEASVRKQELPPGARDALNSCPKAGGGVHNWLFRAARELHPFVEDKDELAEFLRDACSGCGRNVENAEIENAVRNSDPDAEQNAGKKDRLPPWPAENPARIAEIVKQGPTADELRERSPVHLDAERASRVEEIVDLLFPGNPLLCVGVTNQAFNTCPRERWRGILHREQFIVPSPMSAMYGRTKAGKPSRHSMDNTGPRRFLVNEFDPTKWEFLPAAQQELYGSPENYYRAKRNEQAALLWHLGQYGPLAAVIFSGSKSLHGWFYCHGQPEEEIRKLMRYAVSLGADPATWTKSQFVRMPDGRRDNGKMQTTIYLNPSVIL